LTYYLLLNTQASGSGGTVTRDATLVDVAALDYLESSPGDWLVLRLRYDLLQNNPKTVDAFSYLRQGVFTQLDLAHERTHERNPIIFGSELFSVLEKNKLILDLTKQNISATMISLEHTK
jgi:hypothetical protein